MAVMPLSMITYTSVIYYIYTHVQYLYSSARALNNILVFEYTAQKSVDMEY